MKNNKGFVPILLVLFIAVIVGGGTYYVVNKNKFEIKTDIETKTDTVVSNRDTQSIAQPEASSTEVFKPAETAINTKASSITITSVFAVNNSKEFYVGLPIKITWKSGLSTEKVVVSIKGRSSNIETVADNTGMYTFTPTTMGEKTIRIADSKDQINYDEVTVSVTNTPCDKANCDY